KIVVPQSATDVPEGNAVSPAFEWTPDDAARFDAETRIPSLAPTSERIDQAAYFPVSSPNAYSDAQNGAHTGGLQEAHEPVELRDPRTTAFAAGYGRQPGERVIDIMELPPARP